MGRARKAMLVSGPPISLEEGERMRRAEYGVHLATVSTSAYRRMWESYVEYSSRRYKDFEAVPNTTALIGWATEKCRSRKNAGQFCRMISAAKSYAVHVLKLPDIPLVEKVDIRFAGQQAKKIIGVRRKRIVPTTTAVLKALFAGTKISLVDDPVGFVTFAQLCVAKGCVTRVGELLGPKAVQAKSIQFLDACTDFPFGAIRMTLFNTKGMGLTGETEPEVAYGVGTGDETCPVKAARAIMEIYGLGDPARGDEFLFAAMDAAGRRFFADPVQWLGAKMLLGRNFNAQIKRLCCDAGVPYFTARTTRHGATVDMATAGVAPLVMMPAGRWRSIKAITPYTSMTREGAAHIARHMAAANVGTILRTS